MRPAMLISALLMVASVAEAAECDDRSGRLSSSGACLVGRALPQQLAQASKLNAVDRAVSDKSSSGKTDFSSAVAKAWKPDAIQEGVAASKEVLIACQMETSTVLTTPFARSNSQRDHCFGF